MRNKNPAIEPPTAANPSVHSSTIYLSVPAALTTLPSYNVFQRTANTHTPTRTHTSCLYLPLDHPPHPDPRLSAPHPSPSLHKIVSSRELMLHYR